MCVCQSSTAKGVLGKSTVHKGYVNAQAFSLLMGRYWIQGGSMNHNKAVKSSQYLVYKLAHGELILSMAG